MGGNRGKKIMLKHKKKKKSETLALCLLEREITTLHPRGGETLLTSVMQNMKWASVAVLHEKPVPHFFTHNLIISPQSTAVGFMELNPATSSLISFLLRGGGERGEKLCEEGAYF